MKARNTPQSRALQILPVLAELYRDAHCALNHRGPLQLLIATILSAQCTDARVNLVTPALFKRFPTAQSFAEAKLSEIESQIRSTGFFRNKAKNIQACCQAIIDQHQGEVPANLEDLVQLPGIGRKTANVVLGDSFGIPGITVDTHVGRLSRRLGLTRQTDAVKVEFDLMKLIPQPEWTRFSHRMIFHGRQVCHSRKPDCGNCAMAGFCPKIGVKPSATPPSDPSSTRIVKS